MRGPLRRSVAKGHRVQEFVQRLALHVGSPMSSWRKPGPITPGSRLAKIRCSVLLAIPTDGSRGMGPGFRQDDTEGVVRASNRRRQARLTMIAYYWCFARRRKSFRQDRNSSGLSTPSLLCMGLFSHFLFRGGSIPPPRASSARRGAPRKCSPADARRGPLTSRRSPASPRRPCRSPLAQGCSSAPARANARPP
ncbi:hypothetical protein ACVWW6_002919 [Bradyrhizobium sp. USDA 3311]